MRLTKFVYFKCFLLSKGSFNHFSSSERYLIGSDQRLELSVEVTNEGEDAYEAALYVAMPSNVSYIKTEMLAQTNAGIVPIFLLHSETESHIFHILLKHFKSFNANMAAFIALRHPVTILVFTNPNNLTNDLLIHKLLIINRSLVYWIGMEFYIHYNTLLKLDKFRAYNSTGLHWWAKQAANLLCPVQINV